MTERYGWDQTPTPDLGLDITKAPADIQKLYKWIIEKMYGKDVASAYGQAMVLTGILAKNAEAMSLFTSGRMDTLTTYVDDMLLEMTDKDIVSAPEIIMARQDANGFSSPTLSERLNRESEGAFVHNDSQFLGLLSNSSIRTIIINRTVNITSDLTIPRGKTLVFKNYGKFVVSAGKTLTINASIESGRYLIFDLGIGSKVLSDPTRFGQISRPTNIQQEIYPEWFGAKADAYPSLGYLYADESYALGTDSTQAFKACMTFAESASTMSAIEPNRIIHPSVTVSFAPNGTYYGIGDNILGIQSNIPDSGYSVHIKGNGCTIIWKPVNVDDAIFNKYGRIVKPQIHDFNVVLVGTKGQRKGSFIRTSTGQGDEFHIWTGGHLSNLGLGTHSVIGFDTVFMLGVDTTNSHDDLTKLSNVMTGAYNTFMEFSNREAVGWLLEKVFFNSQTPEAIHIKIGDGFSGGLTFHSCEIILREENETFLKAGSSVSPTPIRFINGRMETRGNKTITLLDVDSGVYILNNLQMTAGNGLTAPHPNTRTVKLGKSAVVKFEDSYIYDQMDVSLSNTSPFTDDSLEFRNCRFFGSVGNLGTEISYFSHPSINYIYGSSVGNLVDALRNGYSPRRMIVSEVPFSVGGLLLPMETASRRVVKTRELYRMARLTASGSPCLDIQSINDLPPSMVITSMKLTASSINTNNVDEIRVVFYDRANPGGNNTLSTYTFAGNTDVKNFDILLNNHVYLPVRSYIHITCRKAGAIVTAESLLPVAWFDLEYRAVSMSQDSGELSSNIVRKTSIGK